MNSYELSRAFFDWSFENPSKITPNHIALYFFCVEHCNRLGWKKEFGLPTTMAKEAIGIRSYNTYINTLNDLVSFGFITLIEKSKNQYSSNIIALSNNDKALNKALDKALIKHTTKQSESTIQSNDSIDKPLTINNVVVDVKIPTPPTSDLSFEKNTIKFQYEDFMLKPSSQKEIMAMTNGKTIKEIEMAMIGFILHLLESGQKIEDYKPDLRKHFKSWFQKFGANNIHTISKDQIKAQFKKLKMYEYAGTTTISQS